MHSEHCKFNSRSSTAKYFGSIWRVWPVNWTSDFLGSWLFWAWTSKMIETQCCVGLRLSSDLFPDFLFSLFVHASLSFAHFQRETFFLYLYHFLLIHFDWSWCFLYDLNIIEWCIFIFVLAHYNLVKHLFVFVLLFIFIFVVALFFFFHLHYFWKFEAIVFFYI
jgi:hypothetical protein